MSCHRFSLHSLKKRAPLRSGEPAVCLSSPMAATTRRRCQRRARRRRAWPCIFVAALPAATLPAGFLRAPCFPCHCELHNYFHPEKKKGIGPSGRNSIKYLHSCALSCAGAVSKFMEVVPTAPPGLFYVVSSLTGVFLSVRAIAPPHRWTRCVACLPESQQSRSPQDQRSRPPL